MISYLNEMQVESREQDSFGQ